MNLSISNIAWDGQYDEYMYKYIQCSGFRGLEIAPTRIFTQNPYANLDMAEHFARELKNRFNIQISSMQSIWFGRSERIFGNTDERSILLAYTKKAIDFANKINCKNLVFGCPKNRITERDNDINVAVAFFRELGEYALQKKTILAIEPNPVIYGTNFINFTKQAFEIVKKIDSNGIKVNVDMGAIIYNKEGLSILLNNIPLINHIHISEPNLVTIEKRKIHSELSDILKQQKYEGFISIEMNKHDDLETIKSVMRYIKEVFS